jgi:hypothetical protein
LSQSIVNEPSEFSIILRVSISWFGFVADITIKAKSFSK